jgi:transcriptional regulator with XRE-family HTH domain
LRTLRVDRGLTQEDLAELAEISPDSIRKLERGSFSPTLRTLDKLARGLKIPLPSLLELGVQREPERVSRLVALLATRPEPQVDLVLRLALAALSVPVR